MLVPIPAMAQTDHNAAPNPVTINAAAAPPKKVSIIAPTTKNGTTTLITLSVPSPMLLAFATVVLKSLLVNVRGASLVLISSKTTELQLSEKGMPGMMSRSLVKSSDC